MTSSTPPHGPRTRLPLPRAGGPPRRGQTWAAGCLLMCVALLSMVPRSLSVSMPWLVPLWLATNAAAQPAVPPAGAAPGRLPPRALSPVVQARLDAAVAAYEAGRRNEARREFTALAERGVPAAQFNLGVMHLRRELPGASAAEAERWLLRAAEGGFVTAMFTLGRALEGDELGRRSLVAAHDWYEAAAEHGSIDAMVAMGTAFYLGRGRPRDAKQAAHWYREAANGGDVGAQYLLASMYETGEGVAKDLRLALHWYRQAARQGDEAAPGKVLAVEQAIRGAADADAPAAPVAPPVSPAAALPASAPR